MPPHDESQLPASPAAPAERRAPRPGLSERRKRDVRALAEALWSADGETAPPEDRLRWLLDDLSDFLGHLGRRARSFFLCCLATVTWLAPLCIGRLRRLGMLTIAERIRALSAFERTPASMALLAVKAIVSLIWYEHPDTARDIGWDQRCKITTHR